MLAFFYHFFDLFSKVFVTPLFILFSHFIAPHGVAVDAAPPQAFVYHPCGPPVRTFPFSAAECVGILKSELPLPCDEPFPAVLPLSCNEAFFIVFCRLPKLLNLLDVEYDELDAGVDLEFVIVSEVIQCSILFPIAIRSPQCLLDRVARFSGQPECFLRQLELALPEMR